MVERLNFASRLGLAVPLIQAPMAGAQGHALAAAVGAAGALGSLPCAMLDADGIRREVAALQAKTARAFNLNFFCHAPPLPDAAREAAFVAALAPMYAEFGVDASRIVPGAGRRPFDAEGAALVEALRPAVVSFHFGLPSTDLLARVRATGALVLSSATTLDEGRWLVAHGADAVIAQGLEAGGHRGHFLDDDLTRQAGLFALLPQLVQALDVPVIAAGGIADASGVRAAMALGASAVQVGTAFLRSDEATTGALHRAALASGRTAHTALTRLYTGRPARGIVTRLVREVADAAAPAFPLATAAIAPLRAAAEAQGRDDATPLWCGQNASGSDAGPAAAIVRRLAEGFAGG